MPVIGSNDLSLLLVHDIQLLVDEELQKYTTPWRGSINLRVLPMIEVDAKSCQSLDGEPALVDICDYFGGCIKDVSEKTISRLYFPPSEFPPPNRSWHKRSI